MKIKKMLLLVIACVLVVGLAGCEEKKENKKESEEVKTTAEKKEPKYQFKNNVVEMEDISIKITKVKIIKVGEKGNEYGKKAAAGRRRTHADIGLNVRCLILRVQAIH